MSQNMSKHTQEGLSLVNYYIKYTYILIILCLILPTFGLILFGFYPIILVVLLINIFLLINVRCKMIYRAYEFYKLNSNPNSLYSPTGSVIADFVPFLDWFRLPKIITELLTNQPFKTVNSEGNKYRNLLILTFITSIIQNIAEKTNLFNLNILFIVISLILGFYFLYYDANIFRRIYNIQNNQALELESIK
jgi:hypothetical protein